LNMLSKLLSAIISTSLVFTPVALADEAPQYTHLEVGEEAPFAGTLFNPAATAQLIAESQYSMDSCDLQVEFQILRTEARFQLQLDTLQASYDSLNDRHTLLMDIKNQEIDTYRELALERPNKNNQWWLAGGIIIGAASSIGIFYAATEISR